MYLLVSTLSITLNLTCTSTSVYLSYLLLVLRIRLSPSIVPCVHRVNQWVLVQLSPVLPSSKAILSYVILDPLGAES